tara:strand:- start:238 stop:423 length:186 start_codon:yes stop_codon:yes gene_type:complete
MLNKIKSILPKQEVKVRVVFDIAESYATVIKRAENMSDKDCEKVVKIFNRVFESFNKAIDR